MKASLYHASHYRIATVREVPVRGECERPEIAADYWREHIATADIFNPDVEHLCVLMLNSKNRVKGHALISIGSLNETLAHPREIFRPVIIAAAHAFVLMHNHPSGDPSPSDADKRMTLRIGEAARMLSITFHDHVIVGTPSTEAVCCEYQRAGYFSFREAGVI